MRILIVDDSTMIRLMLANTLRKYGYEAYAVDNIDAAIQMVSSHSIQFILTDWIMPGGNGPTLCQRIRGMDTPHYVYIILITSLDSTQSLVEGIDSGANDFINKPIKLDELRARIKAGERMLKLEHSLKEHNSQLQEISHSLLTAQKVINRDLELAENMQRSLLPTNMLSLQGIAIDWLFCPSSKVSGDGFNFFRLDEHHIGFYMIDVVGHGVAAAILSFSLSRLLTPEISQGSPLKLKLSQPPYYQIVKPEAAVKELNLQFQTDASNNILYFTMIYGVIDTRAGSVEFCHAGHPSSVYLPKDGSAQLIGKNNLPVGISELAEYESDCLHYSSGDRLFFYTDGITECGNIDGELFGIERLLNFVNHHGHLPLNEIIKQLQNYLCLWRGSNEFEDDISMLVLEMSKNQ